MLGRAMMDPVPGFQRSDFEHDGTTREVYRAGAGPGVVVMHEMPGLHPVVTQFGQRLVDAGFTVYMPSLFGRPGRAFKRSALVQALAEVCVAREFTMLANRAPPVTSWLRALAARAHAECGGPGVGAVGMCFTGSFALAMAVDPVVLAAVMSQPGLPAPLTARKRAQVGIDAADLERVKTRALGTGRERLCVMGLRFTGDGSVPQERFATLRRELGDAFIAIEIDSSPGNAAGIDPRSHSVLTMALVDRPGHPTREALERLLEFLDERLRPAPDPGPVSAPSKQAFTGR